MMHYSASVLLILFTCFTVGYILTLEREPVDYEIVYPETYFVKRIKFKNVIRERWDNVCDDITGSSDAWSFSFLIPDHLQDYACYTFFQRYGVASIIHTITRELEANHSQVCLDESEVMVSCAHDSVLFVTIPSSLLILPFLNVKGMSIVVEDTKLPLVDIGVYMIDQVEYTEGIESVAITILMLFFVGAIGILFMIASLRNRWTSFNEERKKFVSVITSITLTFYAAVILDYTYDEVTMSYVIVVLFGQLFPVCIIIACVTNWILGIYPTTVLMWSSLGAKRVMTNIRETRKRGKKKLKK